MNTTPVLVIAKQSSLAARQLLSLPESIRNFALSKMADSLESVKQQVLNINAKDVLKAKQDGQSAAMIKRLTIDDKVFQYMLSRLRKVAQQPDPLNKILEGQMCQHFSGHKLTQLFAEFHNLRVINSYSQNEFFLYYRILQYIQILPV